MFVRFSAIFACAGSLLPARNHYIFAIQGDDQPHHSMHGGMVRPMLSTMGSVLVSILAMLAILSFIALV